MKISFLTRPALLACALSVATRGSLADDPASLLGLDRIDTRMPATRLIAAGDRPSLDLDSLRGRPILLHFWASWCGPCRREMPLLSALPEKLKSSKLTVVFVDIDSPDQEPAVLKFAAETAVNGPVYMAVPSGISADFWTWGVPVTYLIGSNGRVQGRFLGPRSWDSAPFIAALSALLQRE